MIRLEMEIKKSRRKKDQPKTRRVLLAELPDVDGTYPTTAGDITIAIKHSEVIVTSDMLKGSPSRHRKRRETTKRVSLGRYLYNAGRGTQTVSNKEKLHVTRLNTYDYQAEYGPQLHLPLGTDAEMPESDKSNAIERLKHSQTTDPKILMHDEAMTIEEWNNLSTSK